MQFLSNIGFNANTISYFRDSIFYNSDRKCFYFKSKRSIQNQNFNMEILNIDKSRFIPAIFFNLFKPGKSNYILDLYFFNSYSDAMSFFQLKSTIDFQFALFVITGLNPQNSYIEFIISNYINVRKIYLVYPNTLLGKICDIKVACFLKAINNPEFVIIDNSCSITIRNKNESIYCSNLSLSKIRKVFKLNFPYKTIKSKRSSTFFEELLLSNNLNS
jgi:hypothetical protein